MAFAEKVVIVTGGGSGIGTETAVEFAKAGASLALLDVNTEGLKKTAEKCIQAGAKQGQVLCLTTDVTVEEQCKHAVQETINTFGKIDVLVNNAGHFKLGGIAQISTAEFDGQLKGHVSPTFMMIKECSPYLEKTKGSIVNMSCVFGTRPFHGAVAYSVAKSAVEQLTKCAALELAPKGVRCNIVCPGLINDTPFFLEPVAGGNEEALAQWLKKQDSGHPMGRNGQPSEVAAAILFLASDAASFTTGACFPVCGGRYVTSWFPQ